MIQLNAKTRKRIVLLGFLVVLLTAFMLRGAGLFRDIDGDEVIHPDAPKQVQALHNFLSGKYIWYVDDPFFDGYPLFLNHFDEWILRPFFWIKHTLSGLFSPQSTSSQLPNYSDLYVYVLLLRLLYGLCIVYLIYRIALKLEYGSWRALLAALLISIAPQTITASHFATGDIGVDFFSTLMIFCLCLTLTGPRYLYAFFLSGLFLAFTFAAKYNGILAGCVPGLYIILLLFSKRTIRIQALLGMLSAAVGFVIGLIIAIPQLITTTEKTLNDIKNISLFIKYYWTPTDISQKPLYEQIWICWMKNLPDIIDSLGIALTILALSGMIAAIYRLLKLKKQKLKTDKAFRIACLQVAISIFFPISLLLATGGKYAVHAYHFSYLQIPACLSVVFLFTTLWKTRNPWLRTLTIILIIVSTGELAMKTTHDTFFWSQQDTAHVRKQIAKQCIRNRPVYNTEHLTPFVFKRLYLEPESISVFRNRPQNISFHEGPEWRQIHIAPVPGQPFPTDMDWIFLNGPVFPINDRSFRVNTDTTTTRFIVTYQPVDTLAIGIRSGIDPMLCQINVGGDKKEATLPAHSETLLPMKPDRIITLKNPYSFSDSIYIIPVKVKASVGRCWITIMNDAREEANYRFFGAQDMTVTPHRANPDLIQNAMSHTRYMEDHHIRNLGETAGYRNQSLLFEDGTVLPSGAYTLDITVEGLSTSNITAYVGLVESKENINMKSPATLTVSPGVQEVSLNFSNLLCHMNATFSGQM